MRRLFFILCLFAIALPAQAQAPSDAKKHILFLGTSDYYAHDAVSHGMYTIAKIGEESGLFDVRFHTDTELLTKQALRGNKKNLDYFDALFFYTQGDIPLTDKQKADIMSFVREDGKGIIAAHSGTDSFRENWPEYIEMVGGAFVNHPWRQQVRVNVEDREFPATKHFPATFEVRDEIYQVDRYSRDKVRVLMSLDISSVDMNARGVQRTDGDFALTWVREWGKGRVFTSVFGHENEPWDRPHMRQMWLEGIRWVLGMTEGSTDPLPKASN